MKKIAIIFSLLVFCFSVLYSQTQTNKNLYHLKGVFKTSDSSVIPALRIDVNGNDKKSSAFTDINGEFDLELAPGNYELTINKEVSDTFIAFIKIEENGLNPDFVEFTIEPNPNSCVVLLGEDCPKIIKSIIPAYPSAARAVRATGEVSVITKIDKEGKVISAEPDSGHPLLRSVSKKAAEEFLFAASDKEERKVVITFIFQEYVKEKENIKRFFLPYRILVNEESPQIQINSTG